MQNDVKYVFWCVIYIFFADNISVSVNKFQVNENYVLGCLLLLWEDGING